MAFSQRVGVQSDVASAGLFEKAANLSVVLRRHNVKIGKIAAEIFCGACKEQTKCKQWVSHHKQFGRRPKWQSCVNCVLKIEDDWLVI